MNTEISYLAIQKTDNLLLVCFNMDSIFGVPFKLSIGTCKTKYLFFSGSGIRLWGWIPGDFFFKWLDFWKANFSPKLWWISFLLCTLLFYYVRRKELLISKIIPVWADLILNQNENFVLEDSWDTSTYKITWHGRRCLNFLMLFLLMQVQS